ncbi:MAG: Trm112 family protein [Candidatus Omnitrophota bacterium]
MIDKELFDILACPACKGSVELKGDKIICVKCRKAYPVKDDIPVMLIEAAEETGEREG